MKRPEGILCWYVFERSVKSDFVGIHFDKNICRFVQLFAKNNNDVDLEKYRNK